METKTLPKSLVELFESIGVEDKDDLDLLLTCWCLGKVKKGTVPPELAKLN